MNQCPYMYKSPPGRVQGKKYSAQLQKTIVSNYTLQLIVVFVLLTVSLLFFPKRILSLPMNWVKTDEKKG